MCARGGRTAPVVRSSVSPKRLLDRSRMGRRTSPRLDDEKHETLRQSEAWAPVRTGRLVGQCPPTGQQADPPQNEDRGRRRAGEKIEGRSPATYRRIVNVRFLHRVPLPIVVHVGSHVHTRVPEDRIMIERRRSRLLCGRGGRTAGRQIVSLPVVSIARGEAHESETGRREREGRDSPPDRGLGSGQDRPAGGPVGQCPPTRAGRPPHNNGGNSGGREAKTESRDVPPPRCHPSPPNCPRTERRTE